MLVCFCSHPQVATGGTAASGTSVLASSPRSFCVNLITDGKTNKQTNMDPLLCRKSEGRVPKKLHSIFRPLDGDNCGEKKDSGPIEVYGKTYFCKHFPAEFMDSVTHFGSD